MSPTIDPVQLEPLLAMGRIARLQQRFGSVNQISEAEPGSEATQPDSPIDGLVVTKPEHLRYLFGFTGSAGVGWVGANESLLITDARYRHQAPAELAAAGVTSRVEITRQTRAVLADASSGCSAVGLEAAHVSWAQATTYQDWFASAVVVPTTGLIEALRAVKDPGEMARMEAAASIADAALAEVVPSLVQSPTEAEVALALDTAMVRRGASGPAYDTIVATGTNGANPHAQPGSRRIEPGHLVVIDVGAVVDGYRSDMTRTFSIGEPDELSRQMLDVVTAAQAQGVEGVRAGVGASEIDRICRDAIGAVGWGDAFEHGTGHGVGLDIHEAPGVNSRSLEKLVVGQVITVEPGVYFADHGGVRVEDMVVVTENGCRTLSQSPKDPVLPL